MWSDKFKKRPDQSTPQATVEGFKRALANEDWRLALCYLTPRAQQNMIGTLLMASGYATDGNADASGRLAKIMQKHGLRKQQKTDITSVNATEVARDLMKWSRRYLPKDKQLDLAKNAANTDYSSYRIDDDRAYVTATCNDKKSETRLRCTDGKWFFV